MNQTSYLGTIGYISGLYQAGGGSLNSIDPMEYSTGLFINVDCKLANALGLRDSRDIQNLAGNSYDYFQTNKSSLTGMITENGFIFNGTNGWYNDTGNDDNSVQVANVKTMTAEAIFSVNVDTTSQIINNLNSGGFGISVYDGQRINVAIYVQDTGYVNINTDMSAFELNTINYVAISYDGVTFKLYINPTSTQPNYILEVNKPIVNFNKAPITLGYNPSSTGTSDGQNLIGKIYSAKVWAIAKSDDFILKSYKYQKQRFNF